MTRRDEAMRRREERAAELLEAGRKPPHIGGLGKKFDAKLHPKNRQGEFRETFTAGDIVTHGGQHKTVVKPASKEDTHVELEGGEKVPKADVQKAGAAGKSEQTLKGHGPGGAPIFEQPDGSVVPPAVGSPEAAAAMQPLPPGQEHGDWRDPHHNTGYSAAEYAQHHAQNEKFYATAVQGLADGPDHMATKPAVGGPKITKHEGAYYVESHDNVDANLPLWQSGKVPILAGKFKTAKQAAQAAARMDTKQYMDQRKADREAQGLAPGQGAGASASSMGPEAVGAPAAPRKKKVFLAQLKNPDEDYEFGTKDEAQKAIDAHIAKGGQVQSTEPVEENVDVPTAGAPAGGAPVGGEKVTPGQVAAEQQAGGPAAMGAEKDLSKYSDAQLASKHKALGHTLETQTDPGVLAKGKETLAAYKAEIDKRAGGAEKPKPKAAAPAKGPGKSPLSSEDHTALMGAVKNAQTAAKAGINDKKSTVPKPDRIGKLTQAKLAQGALNELASSGKMGGPQHDHLKATVGDHPAFAKIKPEHVRGSKGKELAAAGADKPKAEKPAPLDTKAIKDNVYGKPLARVGNSAYMGEPQWVGDGHRVTVEHHLGPNGGTYTAQVSERADDSPLGTNVVAHAVPVPSNFFDLSEEQQAKVIKDQVIPQAHAMKDVKGKPAKGKGVQLDKPPPGGWTDADKVPKPSDKPASGLASRSYDDLLKQGSYAPVNSEKAQAIKAEIQRRKALPKVDESRVSLGAAKPELAKKITGGYYGSDHSFRPVKVDGKVVGYLGTEKTREHDMSAGKSYATGSKKKTNYTFHAGLEKPSTTGGDRIGQNTVIYDMADVKRHLAEHFSVNPHQLGGGESKAPEVAAKPPEPAAPSVAKPAPAKPAAAGEPEAKIPGATAIVGGKAGRWVKLNGKMVHVKHHDAMTREEGGDTFTSPAGTTSVYKNGAPYSVSKAESLGAQHNADAAAGKPPKLMFDAKGDVVKNSAAGKPHASKPLAVGKPANSGLDLPTDTGNGKIDEVNSGVNDLVSHLKANSNATAFDVVTEGDDGDFKELHATYPDGSMEAWMVQPGEDPYLLATKTQGTDWKDADFKTISVDSRGAAGTPDSEPGKSIAALRAQGATTSAPIPNYDAVDLKLGGGAGGSTGAKIATDPSGNKYLVKQYGGNPDRVATELAANAVYRELGAKVADAGTKDIDGKPALAYPLLDGEAHKIHGPSAAIGKHFMADALLANWDFIGLVDDNILWDKNGQPFRVDQGGTFQYRAQGGSKDFGPVPAEVWSMMTGGGQGVGKVQVSHEEKMQQAGDIAKTLTPEKIDAIMNAAPFANDGMRKQNAEALKARVAWMGEYAKGAEDDPSVGYKAPATGAAAPAAGPSSPDDLTKALKSELAAQGGAAPKPAATPTPQVPALAGMTPLGIPPSSGKPTLKPELNSPARSAVGRLRNFQSMSTDKLTQTLVDTTAHGNDPEAMQALQHEAAKRLGVQIPALTASLAPPAATGAPSAPSAPATPAAPKPSAPVKGQERGATVGGWHSPPYDPQGNAKAGLPDYAVNPADHPLLFQEHGDAPRTGPLAKYLGPHDRNIGAVAEPAHNEPGMTAVTFDGKPASGYESSVTVTVPDNTPLDHLGSAVSDFSNLIDNSSGGGISENDADVFRDTWSLANPKPPAPPAAPPAPVLPSASEQSLADSRIKKLTDQIVMSVGKPGARQSLIDKRKEWTDYKAGKGPRPSIPGESPQAAQAAGQAAAKQGVGKAVQTFAPEGPALDPNFIGSPGRSGAGRLRNFKQMANGKLLATEEDLDDYRQSNEKDYDAENLVAAEINRRINAGTLKGEPRSVAGKKLQEHAFSAGRRKKLASHGAALPDGSFPIEDAEDLSNAVSLAGKAKDVAAARRHIRKRAKALGLESKLPASWNVQEASMGDRDVAMARRVARRLELIEAADSLRKASTPEPFSHSKTSNWVARGGGLPAYIQHIAHDLVEKRGMTESKAIAMAIGIVKRWARGGGKVDAGTKAAAAKAVAEWERLKAGAHAKKG